MRSRETRHQWNRQGLDSQQVDKTEVEEGTPRLTGRGPCQTKNLFFVFVSLLVSFFHIPPPIPLRLPSPSRYAFSPSFFLSFFLLFFPPFLLSFIRLFTLYIIFINSSSTPNLSIPPPPQIYQFLFFLIFINSSPNLSIPSPPYQFLHHVISINFFATFIFLIILPYFLKGAEFVRPR